MTPPRPCLRSLCPSHSPQPTVVSYTRVSTGGTVAGWEGDPEVPDPSFPEGRDNISPASSLAHTHHLSPIHTHNHSLSTLITPSHTHSLTHFPPHTHVPSPRSPPVLCNQCSARLTIRAPEWILSLLWPTRWGQGWVLD